MTVKRIAVISRQPVIRIRFVTSALKPPRDASVPLRIRATFVETFVETVVETFVETFADPHADPHGKEAGCDHFKSAGDPHPLCDICSKASTGRFCTTT